MIITVPTISKELVDGKIITNKGEMILEVDTSFKAHYKFEKYFKEEEKCDLNSFVLKVEKILKNPNKAQTELVSILKLLYCYVSSSKLPSFEDFLGLFDYEIADEVLDEIAKVLNEVGKTATKN